MTYRVSSRSASNYELNGDPNGGSGEPYLHYIHSQPQSASVANIQQLNTLQRQQQPAPQYYENDQQTELHRYAQNADRFSTSVSQIFDITVSKNVTFWRMFSPNF